MFQQVAEQRILAGVSANLTFTNLDQDGALVDAAGTLTVGVSASDGSVILAPTSSATKLSTGRYSVAIPASSVTRPDLLTAAWSASGGDVRTSYVEVVGGYYFTLAEMRSAFPGYFEDAATYPDSKLIQVRREVEEECERITKKAFVPRFRQVTVWGGGTDFIIVPDRLIRNLRSMSFRNVALSADALSNTVATADGRIERYWPFLSNATDDSWAAWGQRFPYRTRVTVAYEYGYDRPPQDLKDATLERFKDRLTEADQPIPSRATSYNDPQGAGSFNLATPTAETTGLPRVDAVYERYKWKEGDIVSVPVA